MQLQKIKKVQEYLAKQNMEAFFVLTRINRQYLSGFTGSQGILVIPSLLQREGKGEFSPTLYVDDRYLIRARRESGVRVKPTAKLSTSLPLQGISPRQGRRGTFGVEDRIMLKEFAWLKKEVANLTRPPGHPLRYRRGKGEVRFVVMSNVIENLRAVKSAAEIRNIRKGAAIIDRIFGEIVKMVKNNNARKPPLKLRGGEGELSEMALAGEIGRLAKKFGAASLAFDPIAAWGANAAAPHHLPGKTKIGKNNFLLLDFGVVVDGMHSDFTRTVFVGKPKRWQEEIYNAVLDAQLAGIATIHNSSQPPLILRGGVKTPSLRIREGGGELRGKDVDKVVRDHIAAAGYGKYFTHSSGHGVGLEIHELPNLSPDSEDILRPGQIVTIEPGIYIEKKGGVRVEDMVIVGKKPEVLSKVPKSFKEMIIN